MCIGSVVASTPAWHAVVTIVPIITNYLQPSLNTTSRKNHNYTYQQCSTRTNYFKYSFFPNTRVIWNNHPYQLVNFPSVISFKAQVSKLQHISNVSDVSMNDSCSEFKELRQVSDEYERQTRDLPVQSKSADAVESPRKQSVASTQTDTNTQSEVYCPRCG